MQKRIGDTIVETPANAFETLSESAESYGQITFKLLKLKTVEASSVAAALFFTRLSVILMISLFILILNIGIALLVGEWLGKTYYGFFIVAAFYLIAGILFHFFLHYWIKNPLTESIIKKLWINEDHEKN